jgi:hypothetical protein
MRPHSIGRQSRGRCFPREDWCRRRPGHPREGRPERPHRCLPIPLHQWGSKWLHRILPRCAQAVPSQAATPGDATPPATTNCPPATRTGGFGPVPSRSQRVRAYTGASKRPGAPIGSTNHCGVHCPAAARATMATSSTADVRCTNEISAALMAGPKRLDRSPNEHRQYSSAGSSLHAQSPMALMPPASASPPVPLPQHCRYRCWSPGHGAEAIDYSWSSGLPASCGCNCHSW